MINHWKKKHLLHKHIYVLFVELILQILSWQMTAWKNKWLTTVSQQGVRALIHIIVKRSGEETHSEEWLLGGGLCQTISCSTQALSHFVWPIDSRFEMAWKKGLRKWKRNCSANYISNTNNHTHILRIKFSGLFHSFSVLFSSWEGITMSHLYNSLKVKKRLF